MAELTPPVGFSIGLLQAFVDEPEPTRIVVGWTLVDRALALVMQDGRDLPFEEKWLDAMAFLWAEDAADRRRH